MVKNPPAGSGDIRDLGSTPGSGRPPGGRWQPTPVFLSGESHGQGSLVGYSPWGHKESDTTEVTWHASIHLSHLELFTKKVNFTLCKIYFNE